MEVSWSAQHIGDQRREILTQSTLVRKLSLSAICQWLPGNAVPVEVVTFLRSVASPFPIGDPSVWNTVLWGPRSATGPDPVSHSPQRETYGGVDRPAATARSGYTADTVRPPTEAREAETASVRQKT